MASTREVVITGLGIVSPIGIGRNDFAVSLRDCVSGVGPLTRFDATKFPVQIAAELKDFQPKLYVKPRKSLKVMSHEIQMGVASATLAAEDANLGEDIDTDRFGVVFPAEWNVKLKALFIGAVFLIDFVHFESKGNN